MGYYYENYDIVIPTIYGAPVGHKVSKSFDKALANLAGNDNRTKSEELEWLVERELYRREGRRKREIEDMMKNLQSELEDIEKSLKKGDSHVDKK